MTRRNKKMLSLFLAAAMVFSMNSFAFGAEAALDNQINYKDGKAVTKITYSGDKNDVAAIENTDNPVSWNSTYDGRCLMESVLTGSYYSDEYLNNSKKIPVSSNDKDDDVPGMIDTKGIYDVIDLSNGYYVFLRYGEEDDDEYCVMGCVEGQDDYDPEYGWFKMIPVFEYDGRVKDFNKSGFGKQTKSRIEALDVKAALVKYENGTVTEIPGVTVGSVKVDKKNAKDASVSGQAIKVEKSVTPKGATQAVKYNPYEYKLLSGKTLPTFTVKLNAKDDAKDQKKAIADATKDRKYTFAIRQRLLAAYESNTAGAIENIINSKAAPDTDITTATNAAANEKTIEEKIGTVGSDVSRYEKGLGNYLYVSKFNGTKAAITLWVDTYNGRKWGEAPIVLKDGTDYSLSDGTVAGETVKVLEFPEGGNYAYKTMGGNGWDDYGKYHVNNLSAYGFKCAFRQSPTDKKKIRTGVFRADNDGFVYSAD